MTKKIILKVVVVVVVLAFIAGGYFFPRAFRATGATSPSGSTFGDAKTAGVSINLASPGANGTSTSLTFTTGADRFIHAWHVACEGVGTSQTAYTGTGLSALQVSIATTSTANPASLSYNFGIAINSTVATSAPNFIQSSSTLATASSTNAAIWRANEPLTFFFNATNTATCIVGVDYFSS